VKTQNPARENDRRRDRISTSPAFAAVLSFVDVEARHPVDIAEQFFETIRLISAIFELARILNPVDAWTQFFNVRWIASQPRSAQ
jgi:hypothetical protein